MRENSGVEAGRDSRTGVGFLGRGTARVSGGAATQIEFGAFVLAYLVRPCLEVIAPHDKA